MLDQFIGQILADKYRIDSVMRDGGLGKTYHATHLLMEKPAAVKVLSPALAVDENIVKHFSREARTVSRIAHPNVLNVIDFGSEKDGATYIVFEGADGETLKDAINREGKLSSERAVRIARQIAAALAAAHSNGVVHRNLNSDNVWLARGANDAEVAKVLDFGSTPENEDNWQNNENSSHENLEYLSPEQNSSVAEPDERSDIYSFGVVFYEMLAGEVPFAADNATDLLLKQAQNPPAPLSAFRNDLPAAVEPIILKAMSKNPDMRYQTAAELVTDLNAVPNDSSEAPTIMVANAADTARDDVKNNMWKTAFVVLAGISLLAIGLIYATSSKQTNPPTVLQTDANGQPVQPLNPATGMNEQGASNMMTYSPETMMMGGNSNMMMTVPQPVPNGDGFGDGYNPWARGVPPPGAPMYQQIPPGGQMIDPSNPNAPSIFMQDGTVLVPVPVNANTAPSTNVNVRPSANANVRLSNTAPANTATQPAPAPTANPQPSPAKTPAITAPKPTQQPAKTPSGAAEKRAQSGKEQDS